MQKVAQSNFFVAVVDSTSRAFFRRVIQKNCWCPDHTNLFYPCKFNIQLFWFCLFLFGGEGLSFILQSLYLGFLSQRSLHVHKECLKFYCNNTRTMCGKVTQYIKYIRDEERGVEHTLAVMSKASGVRSRVRGGAMT